MNVRVKHARDAEDEIEVIELISSSDEENVALDNSNASSAGHPHEAVDFPDEEFNSGGNFADFLDEAEQAHANEFAEMPVERQDSSAWEEEVNMDEAAFEQHVERNFHFGNIRDLYPDLSPPARVRAGTISKLMRTSAARMRKIRMAAINSCFVRKILKSWSCFRVTRMSRFK